MVSFADEMIIKKAQGLLNEADDFINMTMFCNGKTEDGDEFYAYFNLLPSRISDLNKAIEHERSINLTDFGTIIEAGNGLFPSDEVSKKMEEEYHVDYEFSTKLLDAILSNSSEN